MSRLSILGIIPARAGSTRLKNKNIRPLLGKPLVMHTIDAVLESDCMTDILVSTDSDPIKEMVAGNSKIQVHDRPAGFATERATVVSAILDLMKGSEKKYDVIAYFLPTCPLRNAADIKLGVERLGEADSVISTCFYDAPIQLAMIQGENGSVYPMFDNLRGGLTNSKFIQKHVKPSGGFYMSGWEDVLQSGHFFNGKIKEVLLPKERVVDVDTAEDMIVAEQIAKRLQQPEAEA